MYPPRITQLIKDLREPGEFDRDDPERCFLWSNGGAYSHFCLADYILANYDVRQLMPPVNGIPAKMMTAGNFLGLNILQIRALFLPHTVKKDWELITRQEVIDLLIDFRESEHIQWHLVTETHMKAGSLQHRNEVHDPKYLQDPLGR